MKFFALLFAGCFSLVLQAQQVSFSVFDAEKRAEASDFSMLVLNKIAANNFTDFEDLLGGKETNLNNTIYLKNKDFISLLKTIAAAKQINMASFALYSFDDVLNSDIRTEVGNNLHSVFSNLNMLAQVSFTEQAKNYTLSLIIGMYNNAWKVTGVHFSNLQLTNETDDNSENYRTESIESCNFKFTVPAYFERKENNKGMNNFVFAAQTERDAIIQVMCNELSASADYLTYKWVERLTTQKYKADQVIVRIFPIGLAFEYTITDAAGNTSKGISYGFEKENKAFIVQFFSFTEVYNIIWRDIDLILKKIR